MEAFGGGNRKPPLSLPLACRLRSSSSPQDYSLTGFVWSAVSLSPEHLGHGISLKVTVLCDSLREPLTFTCDCKWAAKWGEPPSNPKGGSWKGSGAVPAWGCSALLPVPIGSSTVDLLIYQTLCYTHDELHTVDVEDFVLKLCGLEEFLQK